MLKIAAGFIFLFPVFLSFGQNNPNTLLWEVTKPGIKDTSYLFGTFHEVDAAFFSSLSNATQKLAQAEKVYVELTTADGEATSGGADQLNSWDEEKWDSLLNESQKEIFEAFVEKSESPELYKTPPLLLNLILARLYIQNFCDTLYRESYELMDASIDKFALSKNKEVHSLDENQIDILSRSANNSSLAKDLTYVEGSIDYMDKMLNDDASNCKLVEEYRNLNIDYQFDTKMEDQNAPFELIGRNNKWIVTLNKAFKENNCFVAVGFRHLMYEQGLVQQLKGLGYSVKPIPAR